MGIKAVRNIKGCYLIVRIRYLPIKKIVRILVIISPPNIYLIKDELLQYLEYVDHLNQEQYPNYQYLKGIF